MSSIRKLLEKIYKPKHLLKILPFAMSKTLQRIRTLDLNPIAKILDGQSKMMKHFWKLSMSTETNTAGVMLPSKWKANLRDSAKENGMHTSNIRQIRSNGVSTRTSRYTNMWSNLGKKLAGHLLPIRFQDQIQELSVDGLNKLCQSIPTSRSTSTFSFVKLKGF